MVDREIILREDGVEIYADNLDLVWRSRRQELPDVRTGGPRSAFKDDPYVTLLLDRLEKLERETRPSGGEQTAKGKDLAAFQALKFAGQLVEYLAGWAIDHEVGLAIENMQFVHLQPTQTREHPQHLAERQQVDSHEHERAAGALHLNSDQESDPFIARRLLLNMLRPNAGAFPGWLQSGVMEALQALEYGEVKPIFEAVKGGHKRGLTELNLQLRAVAMVAYRRELGMTREKALQAVSEGLGGVSPNTILSWMGRLRSEFGDLRVKEAIAYAENQASWINNANIAWSTPTV